MNDKEIKYYSGLSKKLKEAAETIDSIISELESPKTGSKRRIMEKKQKYNEIIMFINTNYGMY